MIIRLITDDWPNNYVLVEATPVIIIDMNAENPSHIIERWTGLKCCQI